MNEFDRIIYDRMGTLGTPPYASERSVPWAKLSPRFRSMLAGTWCALHGISGRPLEEERLCILTYLGIEDESHKSHP